MNIIDSYHHPDAKLKSKSTIHQRLIDRNHQTVSTVTLTHVKNLCQGSTVVVYSGSWNLNINAVYLEPKHYQQAKFNFHPNTKFVDYPFNPAVKKMLSNHPVDSVLFLHSPLTKYKTPTQLIEFLEDFRCMIKPQGSIIAVIELLFLNFNRLTNSYNDITKQLNAIKHGDELILCR